MDVESFQRSIWWKLILVLAAAIALYLGYRYHDSPWIAWLSWYD